MSWSLKLFKKLGIGADGSKTAAGELSEPQESPADAAKLVCQEDQPVPALPPVEARPCSLKEAQTSLLQQLDAVYGGPACSPALYACLRADDNSDPFAYKCKVGKWETTKLHAAAALGTERLLLSHLELCGTDVVDSGGLLPLHVAAASGQTAALVLLINRDSDVNATTEVGITPLHVAARAGHSACLQLLLDRGAKINYQSEVGYAALHFAVEKRQKTCVQLLAKNSQVNLDLGAEDGITALHLCVRHNCGDVAELLLRAGATVDSTDQTGCTALHMAAGRGNKALVELLLRWNANIFCRNQETVMPVDLAESAGHHDLATFLTARMAQTPRPPPTRRTSSSRRSTDQVAALWTGVVPPPADVFDVAEYTQLVHQLKDLLKSVEADSRSLLQDDVQLNRSPSDSPSDLSSKIVQNIQQCGDLMERLMERYTTSGAALDDLVNSLHARVHGIDEQLQCIKTSIAGQDGVSQQLAGRRDQLLKQRQYQARALEDALDCRGQVLHGTVQCCSALESVQRVLEGLPEQRGVKGFPLRLTQHIRMMTMRIDWQPDAAGGMPHVESFADSLCSYAGTDDGSVSRPAGRRDSKGKRRVTWAHSGFGPTTLNPRAAGIHPDSTLALIARHCSTTPERILSGPVNKKTKLDSTDSLRWDLAAPTSPASQAGDVSDVSAPTVLNPTPVPVVDFPASSWIVDDKEQIPSQAAAVCLPGLHPVAAEASGMNTLEDERGEPQQGVAIEHEVGEVSNAVVSGTFRNMQPVLEATSAAKDGILTVTAIATSGGSEVVQDVQDNEISLPSCIVCGVESRCDPQLDRLDSEVLEDSAVEDSPSRICTAEGDFESVSLGHGNESRESTYESTVNCLTLTVEDALQCDSAVEVTLQCDSAMEDTLRCDSVMEDTLQRDSTVEDTSQRHSIMEDPLQCDSAVEDTLQCNSTVEDTLQRDSAVEDALQCDSAVEDTSQCNSTVEDTLQRDSAVEDISQRDSAVEDTVQCDSTVEDISQRDSAVEDTLQCDSTVEDISQCDSAVEDILQRDSSEEDTDTSDDDQSTDTPELVIVADVSTAYDSASAFPTTLATVHSSEALASLNTTKESAHNTDGAVTSSSRLCLFGDEALDALPGEYITDSTYSILLPSKDCRSMVQERMPECEAGLGVRVIFDREESASPLPPVVTLYCDGDESTRQVQPVVTVHCDAEELSSPVLPLVTVYCDGDESSSAVTPVVTVYCDGDELPCSVPPVVTVYCDGDESSSPVPSVVTVYCDWIEPSSPVTTTASAYCDTWQLAGVTPTPTVNPDSLSLVINLPEITPRVNAQGTVCANQSSAPHNSACVASNGDAAVSIPELGEDASKDSCLTMFLPHSPLWSSLSTAFTQPASGTRAITGDAADVVTHGDSASGVAELSRCTCTSLEVKSPFQHSASKQVAVDGRQEGEELEECGRSGVEQVDGAVAADCVPSWGPCTPTRSPDIWQTCSGSSLLTPADSYSLTDPTRTTQVQHMVAGSYVTLSVADLPQIVIPSIRTQRLPHPTYGPQSPPRQIERSFSLNALSAQIMSHNMANMATTSSSTGPWIPPSKTIPGRSEGAEGRERQPEFESEWLVEPEQQSTPSAVPVWRASGPGVSILSMDSPIARVGPCVKRQAVAAAIYSPDPCAMGGGPDSIPEVWFPCRIPVGGRRGSASPVMFPQWCDDVSTDDMISLLLNPSQEILIASPESAFQEEYSMSSQDSAHTYPTSPKNSLHCDPARQSITTNPTFTGVSPRVECVAPNAALPDSPLTTLSSLDAPSPLSVAHHMLNMICDSITGDMRHLQYGGCDARQRDVQIAAPIDELLEDDFLDELEAQSHRHTVSNTVIADCAPGYGCTDRAIQIGATCDDVVPPDNSEVVTPADMICELRQCDTSVTSQSDDILDRVMCNVLDGVLHKDGSAVPGWVSPPVSMEDVPSEAYEGQDHVTQLCSLAGTSKLRKRVSKFGSTSSFHALKVSLSQSTLIGCGYDGNDAGSDRSPLSSYQSSPVSFKTGTSPNSTQLTPIPSPQTNFLLTAPSSTLHTVPAGFTGTSLWALHITPNASSASTSSSTTPSPNTPTTASLSSPPTTSKTAVRLNLDFVTAPSPPSHSRAPSTSDNQHATMPGPGNPSTVLDGAVASGTDLDPKAVSPVDIITAISECDTTSVPGWIKAMDVTQLNDQPKPVGAVATAAADVSGLAVAGIGGSDDCYVDASDSNTCSMERSMSPQGHRLSERGSKTAPADIPASVHGSSELAGDVADPFDDYCLTLPPYSLAQKLRTWQPPEFTLPGLTPCLRPSRVSPGDKTASSRTHPGAAVSLTTPASQPSSEVCNDGSCEITQLKTTGVSVVASDAAVGSGRQQAQHDELHVSEMEDPLMPYLRQPTAIRTTVPLVENVSKASKAMLSPRPLVVSSPRHSVAQPEAATLFGSVVSPVGHVASPKCNTTNHLHHNDSVHHVPSAGKRVLSQTTDMGSDDSDGNVVGQDDPFDIGLPLPPSRFGSRKATTLPSYVPGTLLLNAAGWSIFDDLPTLGRRARIATNRPDAAETSMAKGHPAGLDGEEDQARSQTSEQGASSEVPVGERTSQKASVSNVSLPHTAPGLSAEHTHSEAEAEAEAKAEADCELVAAPPAATPLVEDVHVGSELRAPPRVAVTAPRAITAAASVSTGVDREVGSDDETRVPVATTPRLAASTPTSPIMSLKSLTSAVIQAATATPKPAAATTTLRSPFMAAEPLSPQDTSPATTSITGTITPVSAATTPRSTLLTPQSSTMTPKATLAGGAFATLMAQLQETEATLARMGARQSASRHGPATLQQPLPDSVDSTAECTSESTAEATTCCIEVVASELEEVVTYKLAEDDAPVLIVAGGQEEVVTHKHADEDVPVLPEPAMLVAEHEEDVTNVPAEENVATQADQVIEQQSVTAATPTAQTLSLSLLLEPITSSGENQPSVGELEFSPMSSLDMNEALLEEHGSVSSVDWNETLEAQPNPIETPDQALSSDVSVNKALVVVDKVEALEEGCLAEIRNAFSKLMDMQRLMTESSPAGLLDHCNAFLRSTKQQVEDMDKLIRFADTMKVTKSKLHKVSQGHQRMKMRAQHLVKMLQQHKSSAVVCQRLLADQQWSLDAITEQAAQLEVKMQQMQASLQNPKLQGWFPELAKAPAGISSTTSVPKPFLLQASIATYRQRMKHQLTYPRSSCRESARGFVAESHGGGPDVLVLPLPRDVCFEDPVLQTSLKLQGHPLVGDVEGVVVDDCNGSCFLVADVYPHGEISLWLEKIQDQVHSQGGQLSSAARYEAWTILHQVASVLVHAHSCGVPHLALNPSSIVLQNPGMYSRVAVCHWGLGQLCRAARTALPVICGGGQWGQYIAPELKAQPQLTNPYAADVYALGVLMRHIAGQVMRSVRSVGMLGGQPSAAHGLVDKRQDVRLICGGVCGGVGEGLDLKRRSSLDEAGMEGSDSWMASLLELSSRLTERDPAKRPAMHEVILHNFFLNHGQAVNTCHKPAGTRESSISFRSDRDICKAARRLDALLNTYAAVDGTAAAVQIPGLPRGTEQHVDLAAKGVMEESVCDIYSQILVDSKPLEDKNGVKPAVVHALGVQLEVGSAFSDAGSSTDSVVDSLPASIFTPDVPVTYDEKMALLTLPRTEAVKENVVMCGEDKTARPPPASKVLRILDARDAVTFTLKYFSSCHLDGNESFSVNFKGTTLPFVHLVQQIFVALRKSGQQSVQELPTVPFNSSILNTTDSTSFHNILSTTSALSPITSRRTPHPMTSDWDITREQYLPLDVSDMAANCPVLMVPGCSSVLEGARGRAWMPVTNDSLVALPVCEQRRLRQLYEGLGSLLAVCLVQGIPVPMRFAPALWRYLTGSTGQDWTADECTNMLHCVDPKLANQLHSLASIDFNRTGFDCAALPSDLRALMTVDTLWTNSSKMQRVKQLALDALVVQRSVALDALARGFQTQSIKALLPELATCGANLPVLYLRTTTWDMDTAVQSLLFDSTVPVVARRWFVQLLCALPEASLRTLWLSTTGRAKPTGSEQLRVVCGTTEQVLCLSFSQTVVLPNQCDNFSHFVRQFSGVLGSVA